MEQAAREYDDWAVNGGYGGDPVAERLRAQADMAAAPVKTWLIPMVDDMDKCIRERFMPRILQEINARLAGGELAALLGRDLASRQVGPNDLDVRGVSYWRLNRTDFLADLDLTLRLDALRDGRALPFSAGLCLGLWFCTEEGFTFEVESLRTAADKPQRSFWKLDRFLVPILRDDEIETGADRIWADRAAGGLDPKARTAYMLAEQLGLTVVEKDLHCMNRTRSILFFREGTVTVEAAPQPGETEFPVPVPHRIPANTIVLNTSAHSECRSLDVLHECIHYEWHLLFYRLQRLLSTNQLEIRFRSVQTTASRAPCDPLRWMEHQARVGSLALLLPQGLLRGRAWELFREAGKAPSRGGWYNHPGFRWDTAIRRVADEYSVPRTTVRRRLVQLGHPAARGAVNYVDGRYITPFAFTDEHPGRGQSTFVISHRALGDLYHRSREFREFMGKGDFAWADGHVCLNDPQFLRETPDGVTLTPWANAHVDVCCLRFEKVWLREDEESVWLFGTLNSSDDYIREYDRFLDRRLNMTARDRLARRNRLMQAMPENFGDALTYLMENRDGGRVTVEALAEAAGISVRTLTRYRSPSFAQYRPDVVVALCIALHLPPWLSRLMLSKAGYAIRSYGPKGYYGEILDCCFMDSVPEVQQYLREAGYPELKLQS